jgi:hypothetical protein
MDSIPQEPLLDNDRCKPKKSAPSRVRIWKSPFVADDFLPSVHFQEIIVQTTIISRTVSMKFNKALLINPSCSGSGIKLRLITPVVCTDKCLGTPLKINWIAHSHSHINTVVSHNDRTFRTTTTYATSNHQQHQEIL